MEQLIAQPSITELHLEIDGSTRSAPVDVRMLLIEALRDAFGVTGPKIGCNTGDCGACTVVIDGKSEKACLRLAISAQRSTIRTIEDTRADALMTLVKEAFWDAHGFQCGYCLSGMLWSAVDLLQENATPTRREIRDAIAGNLCRCTGYVNIVRAIELAAAQLDVTGYREDESESTLRPEDGSHDE